MAGGVAAGKAVQSGSLLKTAASVSDTSSPSKARLPVSISYSTQPKAHTSAAFVCEPPLRLLRRHVRRGAEDQAQLASSPVS